MRLTTNRRPRAILLATLLLQVAVLTLTLVSWPAEPAHAASCPGQYQQTFTCTGGQSCMNTSCITGCECYKWSYLLYYDPNTGYHRTWGSPLYTYCCDWGNNYDCPAMDC